jgi:hypothetical protein
LLTNPHLIEKKTLMFKRLLICTSILLAALNSIAFAQEEVVTARCALTYKASVNTEGPCTIRSVDSIVNIKAAVEENGQKYIVIIDNSKDEGLLIGAGTFTLADGKLSSNGKNEVRWPNGYVLKMERE